MEWGAGGGGGAPVPHYIFCGVFQLVILYVNFLQKKKKNQKSLKTLVGIKIQSSTLFPQKSTSIESPRDIYPHFRVKMKLIWKRKYSQGAELATSRNPGKCN